MKKQSKTAKIRTLLEKGMTIKQIAARLKVSPSSVYQVRWRDAREEPVEAEPEEAAPAVVVDMVNHPPHYMVGGIETIDFMQAKLSREEFAGYLKGNVIKYLTRASHKGGAEDIAKAAWYAAKLKEVVDGW